MQSIFFQLKDNRILGVKILEIVSLPNAVDYGKSGKENCENVAVNFRHLVTELHKVSGLNTCFEFLWITEKVENQIFTSKIHIYNVIRKIGQDQKQIEYELESILQNIKTTLSSMQYNISEIPQDNLNAYMEDISSNCTYGIVKSEKCVANSNSIYPYYYTEVVADKNFSNFNSLISILSQQKNCCVSFQIFPTSFNEQEIYFINEAAGEMERIATGTLVGQNLYKDTLAIEPAKVLNYYNSRKNSPLFLYNLLVFGEKNCCANIATKIISLLQSGSEKVVDTNFTCLDLSSERINLEKQFSYYPWNINNRLLYYYRNMKLQNVVPLAQKLSRLPYIMSSEEVVSFYRLPLYEKTMVALNSNQFTQSMEQFSNEVVNENNIQFGAIIANNTVKINIGCSQKSFTKHALIVGTPGSGKTTFSVNLLLQFAKRKIPFLAIEPTKSEYRAMIDAIPGLQIFTPGNNTVSPYIVNPFIPPKGIRVEQYIPSLASAFKAAFSMPSPLDMIFLKAIRSCYIQYGWKDYSQVGDKDVTVFGLHEFILVFKKMMENTNYSKDVRGNIESAGLLRLTNLIEQNSNIYDSINTVPIEDLLTAPTVLELNSIDNAEQKALIMALLLINICIYTKHNHIGDGELKNVILIDEAHVLLGGSNSAGGEYSPDAQMSTVKALQDMIAEIRSYGTSIIIADQSPTKVSREIIANTDIKVSFRLVQSVEKELIADSTNMNEGLKDSLSRLKTGEAYFYYSKLEEPQKIITEDIRDKENIRLSVSDKEVAERTVYWNQRQELLKPYAECKYCTYCKDGCNMALRSNAEYIANYAFEKYRPAMKTKENLKKTILHLPELAGNTWDKYEELNIRRLQICSRIKLYRKAAIELSLFLTEVEKEQVFKGFQKKEEI